MMTSAQALEGGIEIAFADGRNGLIPFSELPEVGALAEIEALDLPNPFEMVLTKLDGKTVELPWDFARHYCDPTYRPRSETVAANGRSALGNRVRRLRESAGMSQESLAAAAGIGRVTLVRIEGGDQPPRYETLVSLARALGKPTADLLA
jgi:DNA-binding XRE family transcriptional regulator